MSRIDTLLYRQKQSLLADAVIAVAAVLAIVVYLFAARADAAAAQAPKPAPAALPLVAGADAPPAGVPDAPTVQSILR